MKQHDFIRSIMESDLPSPSRHLLHVLAAIADWPGVDKDGKPRGCTPGQIPQRYTKSLTELAQMTGLSRRCLQDHLNLVEKAGWVIRCRPTKAEAQKDKKRTSYQVTVPSRAGDALELGQEMPQARAGDALELGQEMPQARAGDALKPSTSPALLQHAASTAAAEIVLRKTSATPEEAELVVQLIAEIKKPRGLGLYRRIAEAGELPGYLEEVRQATRQVQQRQADAALAASRFKPHPWPSSTAAECDQCTLPRRHVVHRLQAVA